jgi:leader peptidase (prepilin peptidase)/N-methyltransferase
METAIIFASIPLAYLLVVAVPLVVIDIQEKRLPNVLVLPAIGLELIMLPIASALGNDWNRLGSALLVGLGVFILGFVGNIYGLLGMGDVKLVTAISIGLAWFEGWFGFLVPILGVGLTAIVGMALILGGSRIQQIAAGPFILGVFGVSVIVLAVM